MQEENVFPLDNWTTQLRKGLLELCIVNLLAQGEMYGYDIVKQLSLIPGLVVTEGTMYPLLSRLRKAKLVDTRLEESSSGPARKYYMLTEDGQHAMKIGGGRGKQGHCGRAIQGHCVPLNSAHCRRCQ